VAFRLTEGFIDLTVHDARFSEVMGRVDGILGRVSKKMADVTAAVGAMVGTVGGVALVAMKTYGSFERAMRRATAVSDATEQQFRTMSRMAEEQSMRLNVAAVNAADAFYYLGSAGLSVTEQMQAFVPVVTLAKAGVISAAEAAENMVDTIKGFRMSFADTRKVADVMTQAVISSNMNFTQLGQTLELVAGVSHIMNNSLEDTVAVIAHMANVGIKASMAGTSLRRALLNLGAPTTAGRKMLKHWGVAVYDAEGRMKPFIRILGELNDKLKHASEEQRNMAFRVLFGARAISGQVAVFQTGKEALEEYANSLRNAGGATERVAQRQLKAFLEQLGRIWRQIKNLTRHVGEMLAPGFLRLAKETGATLELMTKKVDKHILNVAEWGERMAAHINWFRRELFEIAKFIITDWPAAWDIASTAIVGGFRAGITAAKGFFNALIEVFKSVGKTISDVFEKLWKEIENRSLVVAKRAMHKHALAKEYEKKKFLELTGGPIKGLEELKKMSLVFPGFASQLAMLEPLYMWMRRAKHPEAAKLAKESAREKVTKLEAMGYFASKYPTIKTESWESLGKRAADRFGTAGSMFADTARRYLQDLRKAASDAAAKIPESLRSEHRNNLRRLAGELKEIEEKYAKLRLGVTEETEKKIRATLPSYVGGAGTAEPVPSGLGFVGLAEAWSKFAMALGESAMLAEQKKTTSELVTSNLLSRNRNELLAGLPSALASRLGSLGTVS